MDADRWPGTHARHPLTLSSLDPTTGAPTVLASGMVVVGGDGPAWFEDATPQTMSGRYLLATTNDGMNLIDVVTKRRVSIPSTASPYAEQLILTPGGMPAVIRLSDLPPLC